MQSGGSDAFRWRSACSLSSGRLKPLSPAKPQHSTSSTVTTSRAAARARSPSACRRVPILRTLHTGWTATGLGAGARSRRAAARVVDELDAVVHRQPAGQVPLHPVARTDWCRRRSASARPSLASRSAASSSADLRSAACDEPLALERLAAAEPVERSRDRRRRSRPCANSRSATTGSASSASSPRCAPMLRAAQLGK